MPVARINGISLFYRVKGRGVPILFIHPPLLTSAVFAYQQVQLSGDFEVITFDVRGHGQSGASSAPLTYSLIAEDIKQLMDHLKLPRTYICGYSTGTGVALEAMLTYPDRFAGGILLSGMSEVSSWVLRSQIRLARWLSSAGPFMGILRRGIAWVNADMGLTYRNLLQDAKRGDRKSIHQYFANSEWYSCTDRLTRIKQPVLIVYGDKDRRYKKYGRILQERLPMCDLLKVPGLNHPLPTKAANTLTPMIGQWIREQEGNWHSWGEAGRKFRERGELAAADEETDDQSVFPMSGPDEMVEHKAAEQRL